LLGSFAQGIYFTFAQVTVPETDQQIVLPFSMLHTRQPPISSHVCPPPLIFQRRLIIHAFVPPRPTDEISVGPFFSILASVAKTERFCSMTVDANDRLVNSRGLPFRVLVSGTGLLGEEARPFRGDPDGSGQVHDGNTSIVGHPARVSQESA
jgi:hypothetical protein